MCNADEEFKYFSFVFAKINSKSLFSLSPDSLGSEGFRIIFFQIELARDMAWNKITPAIRVIRRRKSQR